MVATTPAATLSWDQVIAWRAARHHLVERAPAKAMLEVVADLAGLHAQVMSSAELTLSSRVDDLSTRRPWESGAWQRGFGVTLAELERRWVDA